MGALRFLLAICVVSAHTLGDHGFGVGGQVAVEIFFMISGFLISYILTESPRYKTLGDFYLSRALRIFPLYLLVTVLSLSLLLILQGLGNSPNASVSFNQAGTFGKVLLLISNTFIVFQDLTFFLADAHGNLQLATTLNKPVSNLHSGLLSPQAWSLSLELMFYAIAPLMVKSTRTLIGVALSSLALRLVFEFGLNLAISPWQDRFFPVQIAAFAAGAISHRYSSRLSQLKISSATSKRLKLFFYPLVISFVCLFSLFPLEQALKAILLMVLIFVSLPSLFRVQRLGNFDSWLSNLSFPIYLWHVLAINALSIVFSRFQIQNALYLFVSTTALSIILALVSNHFLDRPVEKLRHRLRAIAATS